MPSIELGKLQGISAPRALSESDRTQIETRSPQARSTPTGNEGIPGIAVEVGPVLDAGSPPVDGDRVAEIRDALRDGSYPLVPTKIADAMIAARVGFGLEK